MKWNNHVKKNGKIMLKQKKHEKPWVFQFLFPDPNPSLLHPPHLGIRNAGNAQRIQCIQLQRHGPILQALWCHLAGQVNVSRMAQKPWEDAAKIMENP